MGTIVANSWDFIFSNTAVVNSFANQERYENTGDRCFCTQNALTITSPTIWATSIGL